MNFFEKTPLKKEDIGSSIEKERSITQSRLETIQQELRLAGEDQSKRENFMNSVKTATIPTVAALIVGFITENTTPGTGAQAYGELLTTFFTVGAGVSLAVGTIDTSFHKIKRLITGDKTYSEDEQAILKAEHAGLSSL